MICGSRFLLILQFGTILRFLPATHGHVFFVVVNFEQYIRKCGKAGIFFGLYLQYQMNKIIILCSSDEYQEKT